MVLQDMVENISATIKDEELIEQANQAVEDGQYRSFSHFVEEAIRARISDEMLTVEIDPKLQDRFKQSVSQYEDLDTVIAEQMKERCRQKGV